MKSSTRETAVGFVGCLIILAFLVVSAAAVAFVGVMVIVGIGATFS
jgi:hypothetical protein